MAETTTPNDWRIARRVLNANATDSLDGKEWSTKASAVVAAYREQCEAAARADERKKLADELDTIGWSVEQLRALQTRLRGDQ